MKYSIAILFILCCLSCVPPAKEQPLENLDKKSAREVTLMTVVQGDSVLHITKQHIWFNGEQVASKSDTLKTEVAPKTWDAIDSAQTLSKVPIFVTVQ